MYSGDLLLSDHLFFLEHTKWSWWRKRRRRREGKVARPERSDLLRRPRSGSLYLLFQLHNFGRLALRLDIRWRTCRTWQISYEMCEWWALEVFQDYKVDLNPWVFDCIIRGMLCDSISIPCFIAASILHSWRERRTVCRRVTARHWIRQEGTGNDCFLILTAHH